MTSESISALVVVQLCESLMSASPTRPSQMISKREKRFVNKMKEQPPNFGNAEGNYQRRQNISSWQKGEEYECSMIFQIGEAKFEQARVPSQQCL
jgi:hypothetical protein